MSSSILSFEQTDHEDLLTGRPPWGGQFAGPECLPLSESFETDIAIIGGGITGALAAEHLSSLGHRVAVIDREPLGRGSTRASTAMLQWEIDTTLGELTELYGFTTAGHVYRRSRAAVAGLAELVAVNRIACAFHPRPTLYLAAGEVGEKELRRELALRERAGLPGMLLPHATLLGEFGLDREAAILSPGSAEADPLLLCWSLLEIAASRGSRLISANAVDFHPEGDRIVVETDGPHVIEARHVVLATGYVMPRFLMPETHKTASSFALATVPQEPDRIWAERALIWEATEPYLYMRVTADNRIIIGGEDEEVADPDKRDAMLWDKVLKLKERLQTLWPKANATISHTWCGAFGETSDGLPLIGTVPGATNIHAAYGYGGNGITFSYLASRMIAATIAGEKQAWFDDFALDRPKRQPQA